MYKISIMNQQGGEYDFMSEYPPYTREGFLNIVTKGQPISPIESININTKFIYKYEVKEA